MDIFEADLDGKNPRRLTTAFGYDAEGAYSRDGKLIAFCHDSEADPNSPPSATQDTGIRPSVRRMVVRAAIRIVAVAIDKLADIRRVEFLDGTKPIGVSLHLTKDVVIPGRPREHVLIWKDASVGGHEIWACALDSKGDTVLSKRVPISVTELPPRVALSVVAKDPIAMENGIDGQAPDPAVFTIQRVSGPRDIEVLVHYSLGGGAVNGVDYEKLPGHVLLPSGAESVDVVLTPIPDKALEGDEGVVLELEPPICIAIFPPRPQCYLIADPGAAKAVIRDFHAVGEPTIEVSTPKEGQTFALDQPIEIQATAIDPRGYIAHVDFYADSEKIGESTLDFFVEPKPGTPIHHSFNWLKAPVGPHSLTVRAMRPEGNILESKPVHVVVVPDPVLPVVSIRHIKTRQVQPDADYAPGYFLIERTGSTAHALGVFVSKGGTATPGVDYEDFSSLVSIPVGQESVSLKIQAIDDKFPEVGETVSLTLVHSLLTKPNRLTYWIDPAMASAELTMSDNDRLSEIASLELTSPVDGDQFGDGKEVRIVAVAIDKLGDIRRVEFFDGAKSIGVSEHLTKDAVIPGHPRAHVIAWKDASVGDHEIWACALDSKGDTVLSKRVRISVSENQSPKIVMTVPATGSSFTALIRSRAYRSAKVRTRSAGSLILTAMEWRIRRRSSTKDWTS